jgi:hypothetical protein
VSTDAYKVTYLSSSKKLVGGFPVLSCRMPETRKHSLEVMTVTVFLLWFKSKERTDNEIGSNKKALKVKSV